MKVCGCGAELGVQNISGKCVSCAKMRGQAGDVINGVTLLRPVGRDKWGYVLWEMRCKCEKTFTARAASVRSKNVKSCGCALSEHLAALGKRQTGAGSPVWVLDRSRTSRRFRQVHSWQHFARKLKIKRGCKCEITGEAAPLRGLHAHHIISVVKRPDLCFDEANICILLAKLHRGFHRLFGIVPRDGAWELFLRRMGLSGTEDHRNLKSRTLGSASLPAATNL